MNTKLFILAAVGSNRRFEYVETTIQRFTSDWDCLVLTYTPNITRFSPRCNILYEKSTWGTLVRRTYPKTARYNYVALILDDLKGTNRVDPNALLHTLVTQHASVISPGVVHSHHMLHLRDKCLYEVEFIEIFYILFDGHAWKCLHSMMDIFLANISLTGWGLDFCFHAKCRMKMLYDNRILVHHGRRLRNGYKEISEINRMVLETTNTSCFHRHRKGDVKKVSCGTISTSL